MGFGMMQEVLNPATITHREGFNIRCMWKDPAHSIQAQQGGLVSLASYQNLPGASVDNSLTFCTYVFLFFFQLLMKTELKHVEV